MKKDNSNSISMSFYALGIATMFIGSFLLLVVFGALSYKNLVGHSSVNSHKRQVAAYLNTALTHERTSSFRIDEGPEGPMLVLEDSDTGYADRIYCYNGNLLDDYGESEGELDPENAIVIGENSTFTLDLSPSGLLTIKTDRGTVRVNMHVKESENHG